MLFALCENKGADQLLGDRVADQCLCFGHMDNLSASQIQNFMPLIIICHFTTQCVFGLVENPEDRSCCEQLAPEVIKLFSCSTQLIMKFKRLINIKIAKIPDVQV